MDAFFNIALKLPWPELMLIIIGSMIAGFAIAFLWINRKGGEEALKIKLNKTEADADNWRLKYYDISDAKEKVIAELSGTLKEYEAKEEQQAVEIEELTLLNQQLMLKQKNASTQNNSHAQEIEAFKNLIHQQSSEIDQLKSDNQQLQQSLTDAVKKAEQASLQNTNIDASLIESLEKELLLAAEKMMTLQEKTARLEQLFTIESQSPRLLELVDTNAQLQTENIKLRRLVQELENDKIILKAQLTDVKDNTDKEDDEVINEGLSSWGAQKLRKELEKLTQQNLMLENELTRLGKLEEMLVNKNKS